MQKSDPATLRLSWRGRSLLAKERLWRWSTLPGPARMNEGERGKGGKRTYVYDSAGHFIRCINPGDSGYANGSADKRSGAPLNLYPTAKDGLASGPALRHPP